MFEHFGNHFETISDQPKQDYLLYSGLEDVIGGTGLSHLLVEMPGGLAVQLLQLFVGLIVEYFGHMTQNAVHGLRSGELILACNNVLRQHSTFGQINVAFFAIYSNEPNKINRFHAFKMSLFCAPSSMWSYAKIAYVSLS